jgi:hypothetical protein
MTPEEQEQAFIAAVEEQLEKRPSPPEGASPREADDWFREIVAAIRPKLVPSSMPLNIFSVLTRTLRRTCEFQVSWKEAREKTDIMLRQERMGR